MILILKNKLSLHIAFTVLLVSLFFPVGCFAQNSLALSVTPTLFEMSANPGQHWKSSIKVVNSNPYDLTVYASVVNFAPQGELGQGKLLPVFEEVTEGATLAEWVDITSDPVTIKKEQSFEIPFTVDVPTDASPGGHFAAILISTQPPAPNEGSLYIRTAQIVTSLFFVKISGEVQENGKIRSFSTVKKFYEYPNVHLELRFENEGNVHLQPRGDIRIYNMWGKERGVIPINHRTHFGNVLPESIRKFEFAWEGEQSLADIGRYKAVASLAYGSDAHKFATSTTFFWIIPLKALLITLGLFAGTVFIITMSIKLYVRRMLLLAGVSTKSYAYTNESKKSKESTADIRIGSYQTLSAPVRLGYNELLTRLKGIRTPTEWIKAVVSYLRSYRIFFMGVIAVTLCIVGIGKYLSDVTKQDKSYDVTISNPDKSIDFTSEEVQYEDIALQEGLPPLGESGDQVFSLSVVNTSGTEKTAANVAAALARAGYEITSISTEKDRINKRSVVVFDPALETEALELSAQLDGALLSARSDGENQQVSDIIVFVGTDWVEK